MSREFSGTSKKPKLKWRLKVKDNGTVDFTVQAKNLRVREVRGKYRYEILSWLAVLPLDIQFDGLGARTRVVLKLYSKILQSKIKTLQWGVLHKLANPKRNARP